MHMRWINVIVEVFLHFFFIKLKELLKRSPMLNGLHISDFTTDLLHIHFFVALCVVTNMLKHCDRRKKPGGKL